MIVLRTFEAELQYWGLDAHPLGALWLQYLFPGSFPDSVEKADVLHGASAYQKAAMWGYLLAMEEDGSMQEQKCRKAFKTEVEQLFCINFQGRDLGTDEVALMGFALGIRKGKYSEIREWYEEKVLSTVSESLQSKGLNHLLLAVCDGKTDLSPHYSSEYRFFLEVMQPGQWAPSEDLKAYFGIARKRDFPAFPKDPFCSVLAVYIMDHLLIQQGWDLTIIHNQIEKRVERNATRFAATMMILFMLLVAAASSWFIMPLFEIESVRLIWREIDNAFRFFGGALASLILVFRTLLSLFLEKGWKWEFQYLKDRFAHFLRQRYFHQIGLKEA